MKPPLTISVHHREVENLVWSNLDLLNDSSDDRILLSLDINSTDWHLISSTDSKMALLSPSSFDFFASVNSTTLTSTLSLPFHPMPLFKALPVAIILSSIVVLCIFGNILVILSVFTFRPLRTVQNFFIVSLAFSDMLVAIMVMPFHIVKHLLKHWTFGKIFCQIFVASDVLLCTSSILNLCAIAVSMLHFSFFLIKLFL